MHIINVSESWNRSSPTDRSLWQMHFLDDRQSRSCDLSRAFQILMYSLRNLKKKKGHIFFWQGYFTLWRNGNVFRHKSQMTFPFPIMVQCVRMSQKIGLEGTKFEKTKYVAFRNFRYIYKRWRGGQNFSLAVKILQNHRISFSGSDDKVFSNIFFTKWKIKRNWWQWWSLWGWTIIFRWKAEIKANID